MSKTYMTTPENMLRLVEQARDEFRDENARLRLSLAWALDVIDGKGMPGENTRNSTRGRLARKLLESEREG